MHPLVIAVAVVGYLSTALLSYGMHKAGRVIYYERMFFVKSAAGYYFGNRPNFQARYGRAYRKGYTKNVSMGVLFRHC